MEGLCALGFVSQTLYLWPSEAIFFTTYWEGGVGVVKTPGLQELRDQPGRKTEGRGQLRVLSWVSERLQAVVGSRKAWGGAGLWPGGDG